MLNILKNNPSQLYEISIYSSIPTILWIYLPAAFLCGISVIILGIYQNKGKYRAMCLAAISLIFLGYVLALSLTIIRGYYMWNMTGDPATHFGLTKQIMLNGFVPDTLIYPIIHIYTSIFSVISSINLLSSFMFLPLIFGILFVPFMYAFAKSLLLSKGELLLVVCMSCTFSQDWLLDLTPNHLSNQLFPLVLYVLLKYMSKEEMAWKMLLLIIILFYVPFHPIPIIVLSVTFLSLPIPAKIVCATKKIDISSGKFSAILLLIIFVEVISWISSFYVWDLTIRNIHLLLNEESTSQFEKLSNQIDYVIQAGYNPFEYIINIFKEKATIIIIALFSFPIIYFDILRNPNNKKLSSIIMLYGPLIIIGFFTLFFYFLNIGFGPLRLLTYICIISFIYFGFIFNRAIINLRVTRRSSFFKGIAGILVALLFVGVFSGNLAKLFPSPYILKPNSQTPQTEVYGMSWLFYNFDSSMDISGISLAPGRFRDLLFTPSGRADLMNVPFYLPQSSIPPPHFGYDNNSSLADAINEDSYLIITQKAKLIYIYVYPEMEDLRWSQNDYGKLEYDRKLDKLYCNSEFYIWYIHS